MDNDSPDAEDPERTRRTGVDGPTVWMDQPSEPDDGPTVSMPSSPSPAAAGPADEWSLDDLMQPASSGPAAWQPGPHPAFDDTGLRESRGAGYYVSVSLAVLLVLATVAGLVVLTLNRPVTRVAGEASGPRIPDLPSPASSTPPQTSTPSSAVERPGDPLAGLAAHPLSTSTAAMAPLTCALPRFDPADAKQARFYQAAKVCADGAFGGLLTGAGLPAADIRVVTVQGGPVDTPCGAVEPTAPATQCRGTVYMTPARLRDVEGLDRYPGKYFGVFLREYAEAVQFTTGLTDLYDEAKDSPGAPADLDDRLAAQATCLAGIASGAMAGRGAVDANITNEIRERLTTTDAPPDSENWLASGFRTRRPASCDTWRG